MPLPLSQFERVGVVFERRSDGGMRVYSQDVPGFVLSHSDPELVAADVIPALETIIGEMVGQRVRVTLESAWRDTGPMPRLRQDRESVEYVASLAA